MEDLEQDPEELPMDEVLAEIRHILSSKLTEKETHKDIPQFLAKPSPGTDTATKTLSSSQSSDTDYFLLTPAMRCDLPPDSELSQTVKKQTAHVLNKLQQPTVDLNPALIDWLNENLPKIIEKALNNHFKK